MNHEIICNVPGHTGNDPCDAATLHTSTKPEIYMNRRGETVFSYAAFKLLKAENVVAEPVRYKRRRRGR